MSEVDRLLRDAGSRLRATAPSTDATDLALSQLGEVALRHTDRRRRPWFLLPGIITAAAAATVGLVLLPDEPEDAIVPAEPTTPPSPTPVPSSITSASSAPASSVVDPDAVDLGGGVIMSSTDRDFDGAGGSCLTVATSSDTATGCADGPTMRSAFGEPVRFRLDGAPYALYPTGRDGAGGPELVSGDAATTPCFDAMDAAGLLTTSAGCDDAGIGIVGSLPPTTGGTVAWRTIGAPHAPDGVELDLITASEADTTRVLMSRADGPLPACLVVVGPDHSVRESCAGAGSGALLAGSPPDPLIVEYDIEAGTAAVTRVDPATPLVASGCAGLTAGDLIELLAAHGVVDRLRCGGPDGAAGIAWEPGVLLHAGGPDGSIDILARAANGTWSLASSGTGINCDDGSDQGVCATLGLRDIGDVPAFPTATLATRALGGEGPGPLDGTEPVRNRVPSGAADPEAFADAVAAALIDSPEDGQRATGEVVEGNQAVMVVLDGLLDDAADQATYVIWYDDSDGELGVQLAVYFVRCSRGVTDDQLCV